MIRHAGLSGGVNKRSLEFPALVHSIIRACQMATCQCVTLITASPITPSPINRVSTTTGTVTSIRLHPRHYLLSAPRAHNAPPMPRPAGSQGTKHGASIEDPAGDGPTPTL